MAILGLIDCPVCGWHHARVSESKSSKAIVYCDSCDLQAFSRGPKSDKAIRAKMRTDGLPVPPDGNSATGKGSTKQPEPAAPSTPKKKGFLEGFLDDD